MARYIAGFPAEARKSGAFRPLKSGQIGLKTANRRGWSPNLAESFVLGLD
jgi:hypothetical protein